MANPYHPYPDARTKRHFDRLESDPAYRARYVARCNRRRDQLTATMRADVSEMRRIVQAGSLFAGATS